MTNLFANLISIPPGDHRIEQAAKTSGSQTTSRSVAANEQKHDGELNSSERPDRSQDAELQQRNLVEQPVTDQTASSPTVEEVAILKEELKKLKIKTADEFGDRKKKLVESKRSDVRKDEATFTVKIDEVNWALEANSLLVKSDDSFDFSDFALATI